MKTTLVLDDALLAKVRERARREGVSMSSVVEEALVRMLAGEPAHGGPALVDLPTFHGGELLVDIADRNALYDAMDDL